MLVKKFIMYLMIKNEKNDKNIYLQNSNQQCKQTMQHPGDKPLIGA